MVLIFFLAINVYHRVLYGLWTPLCDTNISKEIYSNMIFEGGGGGGGAGVRRS